MFLKQILMALFGLTGGIGVAGGFVTLTTMIGVIPRLAGETQTGKKIPFYESCIVLGVLAGTVVMLFSIPVPLGAIGLSVAGLFAGIFIGCLVGALAEVIDTLPIFARRLHLRKGMPYMIIALAIGKGIGAFIQLFLFQ